MKKNSKKLIFVFLLSVFVSLFLEFSFSNYRLMLYGNDPINYNNLKFRHFDKEKGFYIVNKKSYIDINTNDKYVNKIKFDYISKKDIVWNVKGYDSNNELVLNKDFVNVGNVNKSIKNIALNASKVTVSFKNKNIKIKNFKIDNSYSFNLYRFIAIFIFLNLLGFIFIKKDYFSKNIDKLFLVVVLVIGTTLIVSLPRTPHNSWDDFIHLDASFSLFDSYKSIKSEGINKIIYNSKYSQKDYVSTYEEKVEIYKYLNRVHSNKVIDYKYKSSFGYNTLVYLPLTIGFKVGSILHLPFTLILAISKLFNLIIYSIILYYAIKIVPFGKNVMFCVSLIPTEMFLASQFSYDPTIFASFMLAISVFLKEMKEKDKKLSISSLALFVFCVLWGSFPKPVYTPLIFLFLLLPKSKFSSKREEVSIKLGVILLFLVMASSFVVPSVLGNTISDTRGGATSVSGQISFILHNPFSFGKLFVKTVVDQFLYEIVSPGTLVNFAYYGVLSQFGNSYYILLFILIYFSIKTSNDIKNFNYKHKLLIFGLLFIISSLISISMYLVFTPVGTVDAINGVQNRYFAPLLFLLLFLLMPMVNEKDNKLINIKNEYLLIFIYVVTVMYSFVPILL